MPELVAPTVRLDAAWLDARDEWGPGSHEDGFGLRPDDEVDTSAGFAAWVARLTAAARSPDGPRCTYRWIVEDGRVLGGIALRHQLADPVGDVRGHIGYGVRPSARRRGVAGRALGAMLDEAWQLGLDRVLVVCVADNVASARTIEGRGGVLEDIRDTAHGRVRRYWITR
ncbi:GNAT family N-acetyltransferase [Micromonospora auratinigra]|uniref:Predicted acetyltransferase n=1 Tax=Micromonospora auratinigra TaxID=261654 RepID=A0A1A8ZBA4_9ACTN|nr:GNAT family N-acetyltransferase [Micromonospora auratinigra]SBT41088.1 Predicted acetyltransferase [Micromonospora auratinigra]